MEKNDIVQIVDETHPWFPCLMIVDEVKSFDVRAYVIVPQSNDGSQEVGHAYNRLNFNQIERVGKVAVFPVDE